MPDQFSLTEISDFALLRIGDNNETLLNKAMDDLADAQDAVQKIKDRVAAAKAAVMEIDAEITRRGLDRFVEDTDA